MLHRHEPRLHCHDTPLRYAVTLQVRAHLLKVGTYKRNIEVRSCIHSCREMAISTTYCECVFVAIGIHFYASDPVQFVLFGCYLCCSMYCLCVNVYCHLMTTQLQLNISYVTVSKG
jgi:hypothetical protein